MAVPSTSASNNKFKIPTLDEMEIAHHEDEETNSLFKKLKGTSNANNKEMFATQANGLELRNQDQPLTLEDGEQLEATNRILNANLESGTDVEPINNRPAKTISSNSLIVNTRQRGNPILKSVRNIPWEYGNIVPDYVMGPSNCALFLSLRYHQLHPNYIHERLKQLGKSYNLRVLLVQVDVKESHHLLKDLAKICLLADCTLILAFSPEEAGRYLETYKIFENKPPEAIMEKTEENFMAKFTDCLTKVKSVNKTDCVTLISQFGNLANVMEASEEDLSLCPGFGPQKAKRLHDIFHEPFLRSIHKRTT